MNIKGSIKNVYFYICKNILPPFHNIQTYQKLSVSLKTKVTIPSVGKVSFYLRSITDIISSIAFSLVSK